MMKNLLLARWSWLGLGAWLGASAWILFACSTASAGNLQPFVFDSMDEIESHYSGQAFIVGLWSLNCPPCLHELELLARWQEKNPDTPLVLIATDGLGESAGIIHKLEEVGLSQVDTWVYADSYVEKLNFNIDPAWHGELPRSYLYSPSTERQAISGTLTLEKLQGWQEQLRQSAENSTDKR